jgi:hypothetical protein
MAQLLEPGTAEEPANGIDGHAPKPAQSHTTAPIMRRSVNHVAVQHGPAVPTRTSAAGGTNATAPLKATRDAGRIHVV